MPDTAFPHRLFLVERLSCSLALLALLLRCLGLRTRYISTTPRLKSTGLRGFLEHVGVAPLDQEGCARLEADMLFADSWGLIPGAGGSLMDPRILETYAEMLPGVSQARDKLRATLYSTAGQRYEISALVLMWLHAVRPARRWHVAYIYRDCFLKSYLRRADVRIVNLAPPLWLARVVGTLVSLAASAPRRIFRLLRRSQPAPNGETACRDSAQREVLFFPHKSVFYGNLFIKDQFYSDDESSPLHPTRMLHVEPRPVTNISHFLDKQRDMDMPTHVMSSPSTRRILQGLWSFCAFVWPRRRILRAIGGLRPNILAHFGTIHVRYHHFLRELEPIAGRARLALIGYEMLFPSELAMALDSRGIRTVATQERLSPAFKGLFLSYLLDTYLVASPMLKQQYESKPNVAVQHIIPVGLPRADLLHDYAAEADEALDSLRSRRTLIVALDYLTDTDPFDQRVNHGINWRANKVFYLDMIRLAVQMPECHIIIRGKNLKWLEVEAFQDIARVIAILPNIEIDKNYERMNQSYRLCAKADLIIAKHTSLADECISVGKPVLVHDYVHNSSVLVGTAFNYFDAPFFCSSPEELFAGIRRFLRTGHVMDPAAYENIRRRVFGDLDDGRCVRRIRDHVLAMLRDRD